MELEKIIDSGGIDVGRVDLKKYCEICDTVIGAKSNRKKYCNECADSIKKKADGGVVYLVTNNVNNKKYVGITTRIRGFKGRYASGGGEGIERLYNHLKYSKENGTYYNMHLYRSIEKYGLHNFSVNEEFDSANSKKELIEKEKYWISRFKSNSPDFGYNLTDGGEGGLSWSKHRGSLLKYRKTKAVNLNKKLDKWFNERKEWDEKFLGIWDIDDGLDIERKRVLFHMLLNGEIKECKICGIKIKKYDSDHCPICRDFESVGKTKIKKNRNEIDYKEKKSKGVLFRMEENKEKLIKMYVEDGMSMTSIAKNSNVKGLKVYILRDFLLEQGVKLRKTR